MTTNGLLLPASFVEAVEVGFLKREVGSWQLRVNRDAFGHELETELGEVYDTLEEINEETARLPTGFEPNDYYGESLQQMAGPCAIPDIVDFSKVVCFGISGDGSPFCFDYRESSERPRVIWWDDVYWRVIAPDFENFLAMFALENAPNELSSE